MRRAVAMLAAGAVGVFGFIAAPVQAAHPEHKPSKRAARNEALTAAEDGTRQCRGSVSSRRPHVRFLQGAGRHARVVEVTVLDGYLQALVWVVVVDHSGAVLSAVNVASSTGALCP